MKKRFIAKKPSTAVLLKLFLLIGIVYLALVVTFNILLKNSISKLIDGSSLQESLFEKGTNNKKMFDMNLLNPKDLLSLSLNYTFKDKTISPTYEELKLMSDHQNDPVPDVYIYNTHPEEYYDNQMLSSANISYSVKMASYTLSSRLKDLGIATYVEHPSSYSLIRNTYEESRTYLDKRLKEYPSISLVIDIHRDAIPKSASTVEVDGKKYAKILFVVGLDHEDFEKNLKVAEKMNSLLDSSISLGIVQKSGENVNGVYNQDIAKDALLIEIGGEQNNIEEVTNTIELLAKAIFQYRRGGA